jgi:hypothetical protein
MSQGNSDEMPQEVDFSGGVRGKYLARYQRWTGITTAGGAIKVNSLSTGEPSAAKIVLLVSHAVYASPPRTEVVGRRIAPEVRTANA